MTSTDRAGDLTDQVRAVGDAVAVTLLGQEQLAVVGEIQLARVARHQRVKVGGFAAGLGPQELAAYWQRASGTEGGGHRLDRGDLPAAGDQSQKLSEGRAAQTGPVAHQPRGAIDAHGLEGSATVLTFPPVCHRPPRTA